jgi:hypothetical protein
MILLLHEIKKSPMIHHVTKQIVQLLHNYTELLKHIFVLQASKRGIKTFCSALIHQIKNMMPFLQRVLLHPMDLVTLVYIQSWHILQETASATGIYFPSSCYFFAANNILDEPFHIKVCTAHY